MQGGLTRCRVALAADAGAAEAGCGDDPEVTSGQAKETRWWCFDFAGDMAECNGGWRTTDNLMAFGGGLCGAVRRPAHPVGCGRA